MRYLLLIAVFAQPVFAWGQDAQRPRNNILEFTYSEPIERAYAVLWDEEGGDLSDDALVKPRSRVLNVMVQSLGDNRWRLIAELTAEDYKADKSLGFFVVTESHTTVPLPTFRLKLAKPVGATEKICRKQSGENQRLLELSEKQLELLVSIRETKSEILDRKIKTALRARQFESLQALEEELGIDGSSQLSLGLELDELAARLGRIEALLKAR